MEAGGGLAERREERGSGERCPRGGQGGGARRGPRLGPLLAGLALCTHLVFIEIEDGESDHGVDAVVLQVERPLQRCLRQPRLPELVVAVAEAKAHGGRGRRVDLKHLAVKLEGLAELAAVELGAGLAQECRHRRAVERVHRLHCLLRAPELALGQLQHRATDVGRAEQQVDALRLVVVAFGGLELGLLLGLVALPRPQHRMEGRERVQDRQQRLLHQLLDLVLALARAEHLEELAAVDGTGSLGRLVVQLNDRLEKLGE